MQTIELVGDKSVVKLDVENVPTAAFIEFSGRYFHRDEADRAAGRLVWNQTEGKPPKQASVVTLDIVSMQLRGSIEGHPDIFKPLPPRAPTAPEPQENAPADQPPAPTTETGDDAQPDQPKTV